MAIKEYTLPEYVTPGMFEAWKEEEANHKKKKQTNIIESKQKQLENQLAIQKYFPSFATSNKIEGPQAIRIEIEKLQKNYHKNREAVKNSLSAYFDTHALPLVESFEGMLNHKAFKPEMLQEWFKDVQSANLIDVWMETTDALYYWLGQRQSDDGSMDPDTERWTWAEDPGMLYAKILEAQSQGVDFKNMIEMDKANTFLDHIKWTYVENNSLIKNYVVGRIYSFKNGAFKYKGTYTGGAANPDNWEREK